MGFAVNEKFLHDFEEVMSSVASTEDHFFHGENVEPEKNLKLHGNSSLTGNKTTNRPQSSL
jgi:hypothetical protein